MNSRERISLAMRHEPVDRVPVMCQLSLGHYFLHGAGRPEDTWFDSQEFARVLEDFCRRYRFDGFLVNLPGRPPDWRDYLESRAEVGDRQELAWQDGCVTTIPPDDCPQTRNADSSALARADVSSLDLEDPATYRLPGYLWNTWHAPTLWNIAEDADLCDPDQYPEWFTSALRAARAACPDLSVHAEVFSPFTHLMELFGYAEGLMALLDAPRTCHRTLERFSAMVSAQVERLAACLPDAILISSAFAGAGFISPAMYREFVLPYERAVVQVITRRGLPSYVHTCGAIADRLDIMAESGVDGIDTLDPPPLGTVDLAEAKAGHGERFFLKGNLDSVGEMLRGDDQVFENAVRERIRIGGPGSGYILSSACSVAPRVAPERLVRMAEISEEIGTPWNRGDAE